MSESHPEIFEQKLRYFEDPHCSVPLTQIAFKEPVMRGESKEMAVWAKNMTTEELDRLEFIPNDPDLKIEPSATNLKPYQSMQVKFTFHPNPKRDTKLNSSFEVKGHAIIR